MDKKEKCLKKEVVYQGRILEVSKDTVLCPNGYESTREVVHHHGGVAILFKVDDKFIFEKQYRYPLNEELIEVPAGKLEKGEDPLEAAKRELLEETGYRPLEMIFLGDMYPTCGYSNEVIHLYYCPKAVKEERHLDRDENIDLFYYSLEEIEAMIEKNIIKDSKSIIAIYLFKKKVLKA